MSARANGAPTIWPRRSQRAIAPHAARLRRRTGFIWCAWIIERVSLSRPAHVCRTASLRSRCPDDSAEIFVDNPAIDRRERLEILHRRGFIGLMHGLADQPEFQHRA